MGGNIIDEFPNNLIQNIKYSRTIIKKLETQGLRDGLAVRALAVFAEDSVLIPSNHMVVYNSIFAKIVPQVKEFLPKLHPKHRCAGRCLSHKEADAHSPPLVEAQDSVTAEEDKQP